MDKPSEKKLSGSTLIDLLASIVESTGLAAIAGLGGIQGWLAKMALRAIVKFIKAIAKRSAVNEEVKKDLEKHDEIINKPDVTEEERIASDVDFIGGRLRPKPPKGNP